MTRKDFELIAGVIARFGGDEGRKALLAFEMCNALATTNDCFDKDRFIRACQPEKYNPIPMRRKSTLRKEKTAAQIVEYIKRCNTYGS